ncbi:40S ribosomal protein S19 [Candidatus Pacearchaeota archaeon]|nr:40S ribosomal protein S19 [Candidatus Pacearchaeota archaeon]
MENTVYEMNAQEYNLKLAEALKKVEEFEEPEWARFVKSGPAKERPIDDPDFWFKRAASILRQIYKKKIVGVNRLRTKYGSKKDRGMQPEKFKRGSGKIIRTILQQSDAAGFTEIAKDLKGLRKRKPGRQITAKGKEFMEGIK